MAKRMKAKSIKSDTNNINKQCRLSRCEHADITSVDVGRIVCICSDTGYGIEYTKKFLVDGKKLKEETHVIYGDAANVILL